MNQIVVVSFLRVVPEASILKGIVSHIVKHFQYVKKTRYI